MRTNYFYILLCALMVCANNGLAQQKIKQFDRNKWRELVNEINSKRYDPAEKNNRQSRNKVETEYRDLENGKYEETENNSYSPEYSDEGIYGNPSDDEAFFNEENDRGSMGDGTAGDGGSGDIDPRYGDGEGSGDGRGNNAGDGKYDSYKGDRNGSSDNYYTKESRNTPRPENRPTQSSSSSSTSGDSTWLLIIMIAILAAVVIYMIIVSFSDKNKKVKPIETDESKFENLTITKSELELALEAALKNKNYREAVRIYFIAVIKEMKDKKWIKWEKKKTNYHYIHEIGGRQQQPDFITATRAFEIVWYGNRTLEEGEYKSIEPLFKKLLQSIHA